MGAGIAARIGAWLLGKAWNIGAIAGVVLSLYLGFQMIGLKHDLKTCGTDKTRLESRNTQLERDLAQARTNESTYKLALDQANASLRTLSDQSKATIAAMTKTVDAANAQSAVADKRVRDLAAYKPQGATQCEQMLDVDRKLLETLK